MQCRPATSDDLGFVCETFLRSIRAASTHVEGLDNGQVVKLLTNLIDRGWPATVCEADTLIVGWAVHGPRNGLAWYYVREMFRGQGVGAYLLKHIGVEPRRPFLSPFLPNRIKRKFRIEHRPFLCLP
jgi:GNAT superfamily N-acetyltransferase